MIMDTEDVEIGDTVVVTYQKWENFEVQDETAEIEFEVTELRTHGFVGGAGIGHLVQNGSIWSPTSDTPISEQVREKVGTNVEYEIQ